MSSLFIRRASVCSLSFVPARSSLNSRGVNKSWIHGHRMLSSSANVNQRKINVGQTMINFEQVGTGPHAILCLPGALGSVDTDLRPQLDNLNRTEFNVVGWDPPGYGHSRPPNRDFSGGAQMFYRDAQSAHALMKELNLDTFSVLGWSDGGITALILAAVFPDSVRKLVVWGGNAYVSEKDCEIYKGVKNIDAWSPKMKAPMIELYGEEYFRDAWSAWVNTCTSIYEKDGGDICKKELSKILAPTLIIHGKQDAMVGIEHAEYLHSHIANSKLVVMDDGKHNLHLRHFQKFNKLVEEFLLDRSS